MGQYYKPVSIDTKQYLLAHDYDNGLKLMEHSYIGNNFVNAVMHLLGPTGKWNGTHLVWAGDYMDEGLFVDDPEKTLYSVAGDKYDKIQPSQTDGIGLDYIINHTKKQYLDLQELTLEDDGWKIHPLPILTCSGNGRGGGDFRGSNENVGMWAGDSIATDFIEPERYEKVLYQFTEKQPEEALV